MKGTVSDGTVTVQYARAIKVETRAGVGVSVGSGLTLAQRLEWGSDPGRILGATVTIQYFDVTKDGSLRFPSLKAVYTDGRDT